MLHGFGITGCDCGGVSVTSRLASPEAEPDSGTFAAPRPVQPTPLDYGNYYWRCHCLTVVTAPFVGK
jgi:hypothetical protein